MQDIYDEEQLYVCITHQTICPCEEGGSHLISNWKTDVQKILSIMEKK